MMNFILIIILLFGFLMGLKRGFILQALHLVGYIVSFVIAVMYYDKLASKLSLWIPYPDISDNSLWANFLQSLPLENAFYNAIAFAIIFFAVKIILQIVASMLDFVSAIPILGTINKLLGAILGFIEVYVLIFIVLFILALTPLEKVQTWMNDSSVAMFIVEKTPILSEKIMELWFG
ncbi:MAG TPA: CvpA family protein [Bacillota bacterium]|nr:CvpA family protein [Bacillota bacterium]